MSPKTIYTKACWLPAALLLKCASTHGAQQTLAPRPCVGAPTQGEQETSPQHHGCENPGQMWGGFAAATNFYILKKKSCACQKDKVCFPTGCLLQSSRLSSGVERISQPYQSPGAADAPPLWSGHGPCPNPPAWGPQRWPPNKEVGWLSRQEAEGAAPQEKEKTLLCWLQPVF